MCFSISLYYSRSLFLSLNKLAFSLHYYILRPCDALRFALVHECFAILSCIYRHTYDNVFSSTQRSVINFHTILYTPNYLSLNHVAILDGYIVSADYTRFCRVSIEIRIDESNYLFGATMFIGDRITFIRFKIQYELKIQTRDIGAYWFCKHKTRAKTLRISESGAVLFNSRRYKALKYFFPIFSIQCFLGRCSFFVPEKLK